MFRPNVTIRVSLACSGLALFTACEQVSPPKSLATWGDVTVEFSQGLDSNGDPEVLCEGITGYYLGCYPNAKIKITADVKDFTIRETKMANADRRPILGEDPSAYDPGCSDTVFASETMGAGVLLEFYQPKWNPYDCPGPETGGKESIDDWNKNGHIAVFLNGIYVGAGYSNEFELEILRNPLYFTPSLGYYTLDRNGYIQEHFKYDDNGFLNYGDPWVFPEGTEDDYYVDYGQDYDYDGVIRDASAIEPDLDGDNGDCNYDIYENWIDINELDKDGDGKLDLIKEDVDNDYHIDVNEDAIENGGNGNGIKDVGEDLDCDGHIDVDEVDDNNCWVDVDGDGKKDKSNEDVDGDGVLAPRGDPDIDGDCRVDMPDPDKDGIVNASEDLDGDGNLDVNEDTDGDGKFDTSEDLDGDGLWDCVDETSITPACEGGEFGCEGDDVILVTSGDYFMAMPIFIYPIFLGTAAVDGFYTADSLPNGNICTGAEPTHYTVLQLKLVHDDHSDVYGAPTLTRYLTSEELTAMGLLDVDGYTPNDYF